MWCLFISKIFQQDWQKYQYDQPQKTRYNCPPKQSLLVAALTCLFSAPEKMEHIPAVYLFDDISLKSIRQNGDRIDIGANVTVTELIALTCCNRFPDLKVF